MRKLHLLLNFVAMMCLAISASCESKEKTPEPQAPSDFEFSNIKTTHTSFALDISPKDKDMEYIVFVSEKSYFTDNGITTKQDLLDDDFLYFSQMAEQYEMGMHDFISAVGWLTSGDKIDYRGVNLNPGTEYVLYCYGVTFDGDYYTATTDVSYTIITTTAPAMQEITFDVDATIAGNIATINITPDSYDGLYYAYIIAGDDECYTLPNRVMSEEQISKLRNRALGEFRKLIDDEGVAPADFCFSGNSTITEHLEPLMNYMVAVFAVSNEQMPMLCSVPSLCHFSTEDLMLSDMVIDIIVSDITPYSAELTMQPSDKSAPYAAVLIKAEDFDEINDNEISCMNTIIEYFEPATFHGDFSETMTPLMPNEEYVIVAFGCDNKYPTTHLFYERFRATDATLGTTTLDDVVIRKVFDAEQIAALDPSYEYLLEECQCMVLVEAITNVPCDNIYYWWYYEDMRYEYSVEAYLEDLIMYGCTPSPHLMGLWYGDEFFFAGIAEDADGNMSEIYFGEPFSLSREDCSPAEEFFSYIGTASTSSISRNTAKKSCLIR